MLQQESAQGRQRQQGPGQQQERHEELAGTRVNRHAGDQRPGDGEPEVNEQQDDHQRRQAEARVHHMAYHDSLTGLPNRALLSDRLERAMLASQRSER